MKYSIALILIMLLIGNLFSQTFIDNITIRNYKASNVLLISGDEYINSVYSDYGNPQKTTGLKTYSYNSQEYDLDLGIYYFASRIYDQKKARFIQPDPLNQYHSPYVYVKSDPINYVDYNGEAGKPLVLHATDYRYKAGETPLIQDIKNEIPDAHYSPLSDLMNGEIGDLPEWNGNVFIQGHMGLSEKMEILGEQASFEQQLKTKASNFSGTYMKRNDYVTMLDAEGVGIKLRELSIARDIPLKNIIAGGCEGTGAARGIAKGLMAESTSESTREVAISGARPGKISVFSGPNVVKEWGYDDSPSEMRLHIMRKKEKEHMFHKREKDGTKRWIKYGKKDFDGKGVPLKYSNKDEFHDFIHGRIPSKFEDKFDTFHITY